MLKYVFFIALLAKQPNTATAVDHANVNEGEFRELCAFIKILQVRPQLPLPKIGDSPLDIEAKANQDLRFIRILNATTTDDETFAQLEAGSTFEEAKTNPVVIQLDKEKWEELTRIWKEGKNAQDADRRIPKRPLIKKAREIAHKKIGQLYEAAVRVNADLTCLTEEMRKNVKAARKSMLTAIYGEQAVTQAEIAGKASGDPYENVVPVDSTIGGGVTTYAKICGDSNDSPNEKTGSSILSDAACLCMSHTGGGGVTFCGSAVTTFNNIDSVDATGAFTDPATGGKGKALATKLRDACVSVPKTPSVAFTPSPEILQGIVTRHRSMLGRNPVADNSGASEGTGQKKNSQFILGAYVLKGGEPKCNGNPTWTTASNGQCVNYANLLSQGDEIPWIAQIHTAAQKLKENEGRLPLQLSLLSKLDNLKRTAEFYYESTLEVQDTDSLSIGTASIPTEGKKNGSTTLMTNENGSPTSGGSTWYEQRFIATTILLTLVQ